MATTTAAGQAPVMTERDSYGTLRMWSVLFTILGVLTLVGTSIGIIVAVTQFDEFWQGLLFVLIGAPVALLLATWPIAFAQLIRAVVTTSEDVSVISRRG